MRWLWQVGGRLRTLLQCRAGCPRRVLRERQGRHMRSVRRRRLHVRTHQHSGPTGRQSRGPGYETTSRGELSTPSGGACHDTAVLSYVALQLAATPPLPRRLQYLVGKARLDGTGRLTLAAPVCRILYKYRLQSRDIDVLSVTNAQNPQRHRRQV